jgi:hypothetical protein
VKGIAVDLDGEENGRPRQVKAVLAVLADAQLQLRQGKDGPDDKAPGVGLEDAGLGCTDVGPAEKVPSEDGNPVAARSRQAVDFGDEAGRRNQSTGQGTVDRQGQVARPRGARQIDQGS